MKKRICATILLLAFIGLQLNFFVAVPHPHTLKAIEEESAQDVHFPFLLNSDTPLLPLLMLVITTIFYAFCVHPILKRFFLKPIFYQSNYLISSL